MLFSLLGQLPILSILRVSFGNIHRQTDRQIFYWQKESQFRFICHNANQIGHGLLSDKIATIIDLQLCYSQGVELA